MLATAFLTKPLKLMEQDSTNGSHSLTPTPSSHSSITYKALLGEGRHLLLKLTTLTYF